MGKLAELEKIKKAVDRELERFFSHAAKEAYKSDKLSGEVVEYLGVLALSGGKRLRPALLLSAYEAAGGQNKKAALKAAGALELVHLYLLIHDDVIDHGTVRHGQMSVHERFAQRATRIFGKGRDAHFGASVAIVGGDLLYAGAVEMMLAAKEDPNTAVSAVEELQRIVRTTCIGQVQDIAIEREKKVTSRRVLEMYANKTAKYTFQGPLRLGLMLAGNGDARLAKALDEYALKMGIAFQIRDDIIGVFGNSRTTGKGVGMDIAEGKKTLMVLEALKKATLAQKRRINALLGKRDLSWKEVREFQNIMVATGALARAQNKVEKLSEEAKEEIAKNKMPASVKSFLGSLADHLKERHK